MTYQKTVVADLVTPRDSDPQDATRSYELHFDIPDPQKQALYQALMTVVTVVLGIAMTLVAQFVGQAMGVQPAEPPLSVVEGSAPTGQDAMQTLGYTTHFANLSIEGDLDVGDDLTLSGNLALPVGIEHLGLPSVITASVPYTPATGIVATIPANQTWLVHSVLLNTTANFNCTGDDCAITIGDGNDADGFLVLADATLQAADTEGTGFAAGWQGMTDATVGVYLDTTDAPFVYATAGSAETIDFAVAGTSPAAGAATAYVIYTRIK